MQFNLVIGTKIVVNFSTPKNKKLYSFTYVGKQIYEHILPPVKK